MNRSITILDPVSPAASAVTHAWRPLDTLQGKVVGFIDNSKPNFNHLVDDLSRLLIDKYGAVSVVKHRKLAASIPAPDEVIKDVEERCDLVITGSGD